MTKGIPRLSPPGKEEERVRHSFRDQIHHGDCLELLQTFPAHSVDLIFSDPPFNIKYRYDVYRDNLDATEYVAFTRNWMTACMRVLKRSGSFYIAIGDEFVADIRKLIDEVGGHFRNWIACPKVTCQTIQFRKWPPTSSINFRISATNSSPMAM